MLCLALFPTGRSRNRGALSKINFLKKLPVRWLSGLSQTRLQKIKQVFSIFKIAVPLCPAKCDILFQTSLPPMKSKKEDVLVLLFTLLLVTAYCFWPVFIQMYCEEMEIHRLKLLFNRDLEEGNLCPEGLRCLKILINNYTSVQDKKIFGEQDAAMLSRAVDDLKTRHIGEWHFQTPQFQVAILGPTLFPILLYIFKILIK